MLGERERGGGEREREGGRQTDRQRQTHRGRVEGGGRGEGLGEPGRSEYKRVRSLNAAAAVHLLPY